MPHAEIEKVYHYFWKHGIVRGMPMRLVDGRELVVLQPGESNSDAGPDFYNAHLMIDGVEWAGNVEIHVRASDWYRHGHDTDPAYHSVVLHVVGVNDREITRPDGSTIPQYVLDVPAEARFRFDDLTKGLDSIRCKELLPSLPRLTVFDWVDSLSIERLQTKGARIDAQLKASNNDWQQTLFITLARSLGFGLNSEPFEMLARLLPLNFAARHSDNPFQLEALLFGLAGMLDPSNNMFDEYYQNLCRESFFLLRKYSLRPLPPTVWKYARTRPQNFPHRRIALLAEWLKGSFSLFSKLLEASGDEEKVCRLLDKRLYGYWENHFAFGVDAVNAPCRLSRSSVNLLLINAVAPFLYALGSKRNDPALVQRAIDLQEGLPPESNAIIRTWQTYGLRPKNALESQALLQLRKEYCDKSKCLQCRFGHALLRHTAKEPNQLLSLPS